MKETFCSAPSDAQIREAAYLLYVSSGCVPGNDLENWTTARAHLLGQYPAAGGSRLGSTEPECIRFPLNADALSLNTPHPFPLRPERAG